MLRIQAINKFFTLLMATFFVVGCVAQKGGEKSANCPDGFAFDSKSRSCTASGRAPQGMSTSVTLNEDFATQFLTLPYKDANGDQAVSCVVANPFYSSLFSLGTCSCAAGICQVIISSVADANGEGFFSYRVTDATGEDSNENEVTVKIKGVNDAPSLAVVSPGTLLESSNVANQTTGTNTISVNLTANITGSDIETPSGLMVFEVKSYTAGVTLSGCMGAYGAGTSALNSRNCILTVPEEDVGTVVNYPFKVRAFDGQNYSLEKDLTLTVNFDLDDLPTFAVPSGNFSATEDTVFTVTGMQLTDRDSWVSGATCNISDLTNIMQTSACICNASGACSVTFLPIPDYSGSVSFKASATNSHNSNEVTKNITVTSSSTDKPVAPLLSMFVLESPTIDGLEYKEGDILASHASDTIYSFSSYSAFKGYDVDSGNDAVSVINNIVSPSPDLTFNCSSLSSTCEFSVADGNLASLPGSYNQAVVAVGAGASTITIRAKAPGAHTGMTYNINYPVGLTGGPYVAMTDWNLTVYASTAHNLSDIVSAINNSKKANKVFEASTSIPGSMASGVNRTGNIDGGLDPTYMANYSMTVSGKTTTLGRMAITIINVNDHPVLCKPTPFNYNISAINGCPEEGCIGDDAPTAEGIVPKLSNLMYYSRAKGICYRSNLSLPTKWEVMTSTSGLIPNQVINEKDKVIITGIKLHEGGGGSNDAADHMSIRRVGSTYSSNQLLFPDANITFKYNGVALGTGANIDVTDDGDGAHDLDFSIEMIPVGTLSGSSTISFQISDGINISNTISFTVTVNASSAQHKGWKAVTAYGPELDRFNQVVGTPVCSFSLNKCNNGGACTGTANPTFNADGYVSGTTTADGTIFYNSATNRCFIFDSAQGPAATNRWVEFQTYCPISSKSDEPNCSTRSCYENFSIAGPPTFAPSKVGLSVVNGQTGACYRSVGTASAANWKRYMGSGEVTLTWESFNHSGTGSINGHNVYRKLKTDFAFDYNKPINKTILGSGIRTYVDNGINSFTPPLQGTVYEYEVRPTINSIATQTNEVFKKLRVIVPNSNQAFVHRDIVNKRMCTMIAASDIDPSNHNRCSYTGFGSTMGETILDNNLAFYDIGKDLIVDRFELGCNYSKSGCNDTADGACIGMHVPSTAPDGNANALYYRRSTGQCYHYESTDGGWKVLNERMAATNLNITQRIPELDEQPINSSGLPPLVNIDWTHADSICSSRLRVTGNPNTANREFIHGIKTAETITPDLPRRKQQIAYSLWDTLSLTSSTITTREAGLSLNSSAKCNSSQASGLTGGYSDSDTPDSSSIYSLPGTFSSNIRSLATGNSYTNQCSSLFGVRDHIGNVKEWTKSGIECDYGFGGARPYQCRGIIGQDPDFEPLAGLDPQISNYLLDNFISYCGENVDGLTPCDDNPITSWILKNGNTFGLNVQSFNVPMGLPLMSSITTNFRPMPFAFDANDLYNPAFDDCDNSGTVDSLDVETPYCSYVTQFATAINSPSLSVADLHEDGVIFNIQDILDGTNRGYMATGGGYLDGNAAGVWAFETVPEEDARSDIGVRCVIEVSEDSFQ